MEKELIPQEVREFSKENAPEQRQQTAQEIKSKRLKYFERKKTLFEEIKQVEPEKWEKEGELERINREIENLQTELAGKTRKKVVELLNYFEIKRIRRELGEKKVTQEQFEKEYEQNKELFEELRGQLDDKSELDQAGNKLDEFYQKQKEKLEIFEDQKVSKISNVVSQHNVIVIHGIHPSFTPKHNSLLEQNVDWKTKLKIMVSMEPTISASTIQEGDTPDNMWARMGVILNGGRVQEAYPMDAGTLATKEGRTRIAGPGQKRIKEQIETAIQERGGTGHGSYNELVVQNPKIAGFYICREQKRADNAADLESEKAIAETAQQYSMPLYIIEGGKPYEASYNPTTQTISKEGLIKPEDIIKKGFRLSETQKEQHLGEIFEDCPFKEVSPEIHYLESKTGGQEFYLTLNADSNVNRLKQTITNEKKGSGMAEDLVVERTVMLGEPIQGRGEEIRYFQIAGEGKKKLIKQALNLKTGQYKTEQSWHSLSEYVCTATMSHAGERAIKTKEDYLSEVEAILNKYISNLKEAEAENNPIITKIWKDALNELVFHLYGFAEQAGKNGDVDSEVGALEIAHSILPIEKYKEILAKRTGKKGCFRMLPEDMGLAV